MKKFEIAPKNRRLIESIIHQNPKLDGNEHLMDEFCEAIYKKSYLLIDTIKDAARLKKHLNKICDNCMDQIICEKGNPKSMCYNLVSECDSNEILEAFEANRDAINKDKARKAAIKDPQSSIANIKEDIIAKEEENAMIALPDPLRLFPPKTVSKTAVDKLMFIVKELSNKYPSKKYYEIFSLRYVKMLSHVDTAQKLKISQVELSRRFVELIRLARESV